MMLSRLEGERIDVGREVEAGEVSVESEGLAGVAGGARGAGGVAESAAVDIGLRRDDSGDR